MKQRGNSTNQCSGTGETWKRHGVNWNGLSSNQKIWTRCVLYAQGSIHTRLRVKEFQGSLGLKSSGYYLKSVGCRDNKPLVSGMDVQ